jgi:fucose permease
MPRPAAGRSLRTARLSVASTFFVHAAVSGSLAPRIPAIKADLGLSNGGLGLAMTGFALGLFAGTRVAAWLIRRLGSRGVVRAGLPILSAALLGPALARDLVELTPSLLVLGGASGLLDVALNTQAVVVERAYRRPIMSSLHGMWSVGLLVASALASTAAALHIRVLVHFGLAALVLVAAGAVAPRALRPAAEEQPSHASTEPQLLPPVWSGALLALAAIGFSAFLGEGAAADWSSVYVRDRIGAREGVAAAAFATFALGMVAARFTVDRLAARFGPVAVVRTGGSVAALGLALALLIPDPRTALAGFALLGLGLAPVVPLTFSAAGNLGGAPAAAALGWVVTLGYVGSVLGPAVIGYIAQAVGLRAGLVLPAALCAVIAALASFAGSAAGGAPPYRRYESREVTTASASRA